MCLIRCAFVGLSGWAELYGPTGSGRLPKHHHGENQPKTQPTRSA